MLIVDETFRSFEEWDEWSKLHPSVLSASESDRIAARVLAAGLVEPMTLKAIRAEDIDTSANDKNWREGLAAHGLNSRGRAVLALIDEKVRGIPRSEVRIFAPEGLTAFALTMRGLFVRFLGSEYGHDEDAREALFPIPHQDLTNLTLPSNCFDLVTTNEVLEHVPDLDQALKEIVRVLKPGGWHVGTHPFAFTSRVGIVRSKLVDGRVVHLREPEYHGNPTDPARGSLVFETPAWDIIKRATAAGFTSPHMRFVASEKHGYLTENTGVFVLCAQK